MTETGENMGQLTALVPYATISAANKKWNSFPSNVCQLSLKRSHPLPQMFASFPSNVSRNKTHYLGNPFPDISTEHRKVPNENHIWWIYEQQIHIKMNLQPHQVPHQVPPQVPHQVLVFLIFR